MSQVTLTVPTINLDDQAVVVALVLIGAGLLTTLAYEIIKRRYTTKQLKKFGEDAQKRAKSAVAIIFTALASLFTALGYLLFLAQDHVDFLQSLPFVGKHVMTVVGVGWFVYNLRLHKTYVRLADVLGKWSRKKETPPTVFSDEPLA